MKASSSLLIEDHPLIVLPKLAAVIGLNEAIVLQQIKFWLNRSTNEIDGRLWTYRTLPEWKEQFPFWCEDTVKRTLKSLRDQGLVIAKALNNNSWDRTLWYTIDYEKLEEIATLAGSKTAQNEGCKNGSPKSAKAANGEGENIGSKSAKSTDRQAEDQPLFIQETTQETTTKDLTRAAVPGSNMPLFDSQTITTPARVIVPPSPYMPKGLKLAGGHIPAGEGSNPVQVYYERFRFDTDRLTAPQEDDLAKLCPDLNRLREVVIAYSQSGYKSRNVKLILDWYRGGVPQPKRAGQKPTLREAHDQQVRNRFGRQPNPASVSTPAPNREGSDNGTNQPAPIDLTDQINAIISGFVTTRQHADRAAD